VDGNGSLQWAPDPGAPGLRQHPKSPAHLDTGFQGAIDSEGWQRLEVTDPNGELVLSFEGRGELAEPGVTALCFETVGCHRCPGEGKIESRGVER